jgi:streptomycin 6-kinase
MDLPPAFISNIQNAFREAGAAFLASLSDSIDEASARWNLTEVQSSPLLSYNFVAFAIQGEGVKGQGKNVVLKMGVPNREFLSEMEALRLFNGEGACSLIDFDEDKCWMLLERLKPGEMLASLENDEEATHIAAGLMKKIWRPVAMESASLLAHSQMTNPLQEQAPGLHRFIRLTDWFDGLKRLRQRFNGGTGPLDEQLVRRAERSVSDFFIENQNPVLMHGDFHHYNILSSERGWLIIDPKGVVGPAGYEVGPLLMNPWGEMTDKVDIQQITKRRIDILHERLGFENDRIREWGLAHAVLSAWWGIEDKTGWEYSMAVAKMLAGLF